MTDQTLVDKATSETTATDDQTILLNKLQAFKLAAGPGSIRNWTNHRRWKRRTKCWWGKFGRFQDFKTVEEQGTVKEQFRPDPKQVDIEKNSNVEESDQTLIKIMLKQQLLMIKPSEPTLGDHNRQLAAGPGSIRSSFPASHQHHLLWYCIQPVGLGRAIGRLGQRLCLCVFGEEADSRPQDRGNHGWIGEEMGLDKNIVEHFSGTLTLEKVINGWQLFVMQW